MQKNSDFGLNFTGSNDVKNLTTSQSPPPSQLSVSVSEVGLGHSPQDACVSPDLHVTKTEKSMCKLIHYTMLIIKEVKIATIGTYTISTSFNTYIRVDKIGSLEP